MAAPFGTPFVDPRKKKPVPPGRTAPGQAGPLPGPLAGPPPPGGPLPPPRGAPPLGPPGAPGMGPMGAGPPGMGQPMAPPPRPPADIPPAAAGGPMVPTMDGPVSQLALAAALGGLGDGGPRSLMGSPQGGPMAPSPGGLLAPNSSLDTMMELLSRAPANPGPGETSPGMSDMVPTSANPIVGPMGAMGAAGGRSPGAMPGNNPGLTQQEAFMLSLVNQPRNQGGMEALLSQVGPGVEPGFRDIDEETMRKLMGSEGWDPGLQGTSSAGMSG